MDICIISALAYLQYRWVSASIASIMPFFALFEMVLHSVDCLACYCFADLLRMKCLRGEARRVIGNWPAVLPSSLLFRPCLEWPLRDSVVVRRQHR